MISEEFFDNKWFYMKYYYIYNIGKYLSAEKFLTCECTVELKMAQTVKLIF